MREIPSSKAYRVLEPGPVVLLATSENARPNVMTMGFHMMVQHDPALIGCVVGPWDHSHRALISSKECVIGVPGADLAKKVVDIGNCSGSEVNKFHRFRLTAQPARYVKAPLITQCLFNIECRVADLTLAEKYHLFLLEAVGLWVNDDRRERRFFHHNGDGTFTVDGRKVDLRKRMVRWKQFQTEL